MERITEAKVAGNGRDESLEREAGVLVTWMALGQGMTQMGVSQIFGLMNDVRVEASACTTALLDAVETAAKSAFRLGRRLNERLDAVAARLLDTGERGARALLN